MNTEKGGAPTPFDRLSRWLVTSALKRAKEGGLRIVYPDGKEEHFGESSSPPVMKLKNLRVFSGVIKNGGIGMGETYVNGDWDSDDLTGVLAFLLNNWSVADERKLNLLKPIRFLSLFKHYRARNSKKGSRHNILAHYDLGNELFESFLDPTMMYSCGIYRRGDESLEEAQKEKLRVIIEKARIESHHHVLEIGSGWGGFAIEAAKTTGCRVTSITVSDQQFALATQRVKEAGLSGKVFVKICDYRDLEGQFDRIVSIEMMEAIGHSYLGAFFGKLEQVLKRDGLAVLQVITLPDQWYDSYRFREDWIQKYIFPGSHLPSLSAMLDAIRRRTKFIIEDIENIGPHYGPTLAEWRRRFLDRCSSFNLDERFKRIWVYYLSSCEAEFNTRWLSDLQIVLTRPNNTSLERYTVEKSINTEARSRGDSHVE